MPRSILAQLVVALRDDASRNAKALASNLKGLGDSASSFASKLNGAKWGAAFERDARRVRASAQEMAAALGSNSLGWGDKFSKELLKLRATPREFAKIRDSYLELQRVLNAPGTRRYGATVLDAQRAWRNQITADLHVVRAERTRLREEAAKPIGIARKGIRMGAAAVGVYGGVHGAGRVARGTAIAGASDQRETFRQSLAGLNAEEIAKISAASEGLAGKYPSVSRVDIRELARGARNLTGDVGKGLALLPDIIRARVAIQSATGGSGDGELDQLLKSADIAGLQDDPGRFKAFLENFSKAVQVEGRQLNAGDYLSFFKRAKMAGSGFSDEFIAAAMPTLSQELGGATAGTALATAYQQFVSGRAKKETLKAQRDAGLRDKNNVLIERQAFISDPFEWIQKHIRPLLERSGVDMSNNQAMLDFLTPLTSDRNAAEVVAKSVLQADQIRRNQKMYSGAKGEDLRKGALSGISARHAIIDKRRIEAIEKLWTHVSDRSPLKSLASFTKGIKLDVLLKGASKGNAESIKLRQFAEIIRKSSGLSDISIIPPQNALLKERIFLPQTLWSKYIAYDQALNAPFGYLSAVENGIDGALIDIDPVLKLFKDTLPNYAEFIDQKGINSISHLIEPLEKLLLEEAISSLGVSPSDNIVISQAATVIEAADRAAAERALSGIEIPSTIRA